MRTLFIAAVFGIGFASGLMAAAPPAASPGLPAERVTGIGGVFFKARDPKGLARWYREHLGVAVDTGSVFASFDWREREEPARDATTAWAIFRSQSRYFAPSEATFMIDYRVHDLDRMLAQLKALGVEPVGDISADANGRFAWILDPEGNKIELWEPKTEH